MGSALPSARLPLSNYERLRTKDVDQARRVLAGAFCPHRLKPLDNVSEFETRFHAAGTGDVSLCYLDYGSPVHVAAHEMESFHVVMIPLAGRAEVTSGREHTRNYYGTASVPPVDRAFEFRMAASSPFLVFRVERRRLEEHLRSLLARPVTEPVRFTLEMNLTTPPVRSWRSTLRLLLNDINGGGPIHSQPLAMREMERLLLTQLLLAQPSNYSGLLHESPLPTTPRAIRRAAALIEERAAEPLTVEDIAEAAGLSVRALQKGFRRYLDTTPMNRLREVRLRRVRDELTAADPASTTVTDTAIRWGFLHPGRFSAYYRRRFGEPPSAALRR